MDTDSLISNNEAYIERLQQAVRVMGSLSEADRANFCISVIAVRRSSGISACIGGLCGLDPWFRAQGFSTTVDDEGPGRIGQTTLSLEEFFGTDRPFYRCHYGTEFDGREITADDAIAALRREITLLTESTTTAEASAA